MDDLVQWLRAQLDEDERAANAAVGAVAGHGGSQVWPDIRAYADDEVDALDVFAKAVTPARVLREVEAKRRILDEHGAGCDPCDAHDASQRTVPCDTLLALALPYSDHSGYREEWRP